MKKITALVLALMMACLMTCAFAAEADPLYTGEWYLKTWQNGDETIDVAAMGLNGVMTLNDDWTCSMTGMGNDVTGTWKDEADKNKITVTMDGDDLDVMLSDGELTVSAGETKMIFTREAPAAAGDATAEIKADAAAEEFNGSWNCIAMGVGSMKLDAAAAKAAGQELPTLKFEDGAISMEGGQIAETLSAFKMLSLTFADGTYSFTMDGVSIKANILQDGTMALEIALGETAVALYFEKAE